MGVSGRCIVGVSCVTATLIAIICVVVVIIVKPCLFGMGDCDSVSYKASAKLTMVEENEQKKIK